MSIEMSVNGTKLTISDKGDVVITTDKEVSVTQDTRKKLSRQEKNVNLINLAIENFVEYRDYLHARHVSNKNYVEQTLSLSLGRQSGHSAYIMNNAKDGDIVISLGTGMMLDFLKRDKLSIDDGKLVAPALKIKAMFAIDQISQIYKFRGLSFYGKRIWIDNASYMRDANPMLYNMIKQAIMLCSDEKTVIIELG